jgi:CHRD domain
MKRVIAVFVGLLVFAGIAGAEVGQQSKRGKITICHRTLSAKKPYVKIRVTAAQLQGHQRHAADIIPAPAAGCPKQAITPTRGGVQLTATLTGANEVPGPGDTDGAGTASIRTLAGLGQICYLLNVSKITLPATAAHIHSGAAGVAGPPVVGLKPPAGATATATTGSSRGCVTTPRALVAAILANPSNYYVNVHTTDFPDGAIRGQLSA